MFFVSINLKKTKKTILFQTISKNSKIINIQVQLHKWIINKEGNLYYTNSQTCIKRSHLGKRKYGLLRQITS